MSSPLTDSTIANGDVIEAVHITQMFSILADLEDGQAFFRDDVGSANAYQVNFNGSPSNKNQFTAYKKGMLVVFKAANANTGASTLQVVGPSGALSAIPLTKGGNALIAGEIAANQMLLAVYNDAAGGRFDLVGVAGASNFDGLSDVAISSPTSGQVVRHNGSNFVNANLTASDMPTGIDAARIGGGAVSNTEFGYLDGVTSAIQTQLDGKAASSHTHAASDINSGQLALARGGTGADLSATGGSGQVLKQNSAGGAITVSALTASDLPTGIDAVKIGGGAVSNTEFGYLDGVTSAIQTQLNALNLAKVPVGCVAPFAGSSAPTGWLLCYGQNVSRATYSALFSAIGTTYGSGDGSSTFTLPDLRGRVAAGADAMGGSSANRLTTTTMTSASLNGSGGTQTCALDINLIPSHSHSIATRNGGGGNPNAPAAALGGYYGDVSTQPAGNGTSPAHNNVQPTLILNYIIYAGV